MKKRKLTILALAVWTLAALSDLAHAQSELSGGNSRLSGASAGLCLPSNPLVSISVTPGSITALSGQNATFDAVGTYADQSQQDLTSVCSWSSSNTAIATVTSPGVLNCSGTAGTVTVTASYAGINGTASLTCNAPPIITTASLPGATVNVAYSSGNIQAAGGTLPYTWSITSGSLPGGLTLNNTSPNATITGTPTALGTSTFTLQVRENGGSTGTKTFSITVSAASSQLPALPQRWMNGRFAFETSPHNPISYYTPFVLDGVSTWSCHGGQTIGPFSANSIGAINSAITVVEACRNANPSDPGYEIQIPAGTLLSTNFTSGSYISLPQTAQDSSNAPIRITSTNPYPITDPANGDPRDQIPGTYNLASSSPLVRAGNVVTVTTMNSMPTPPAVGDLATITRANDTSFNGEYTVCGPPTSGCITPTATQFTYLQTGANATSPGCAAGNMQCFPGMIYSFQAQSPIQSIAITGCVNNGDCNVTLHFASAPGFTVGNRFDIVNSVASGSFNADPNVLNTTWYVASVGSDSNCSTCAVSFNTYRWLVGNSTTWTTQGTALHFNHIPQDQINAYAFTLETTGGNYSLIGCAPGINNCHDYEIDSAELRIASNATSGIPQLVDFEPYGYSQTPTPAMSEAGCSINATTGLANPNQTNCDVPVQMALNNSWLHTGTYASPCRFPTYSPTACTMTRAVALACYGCSVSSTRISEIHQNGAESHGISGSGMQVFKLSHNFIEGTSENFFFSYLPKVSGMPQGYFCDGQISGNILTDDWFDVIQSGGKDPTTGKQNYQYLHKNKGEFKNSCRDLVEGNIIERSAGGVGEQQGVLTGNNSTANNGTSNQPQWGSQSHDVTYAYNLYRHGMGIGYYPSRSNITDTVNYPTHHYAWIGNLGYDLGNLTMYGLNCYTGSGSNGFNCSFTTLFQIANRGQFYPVTSATSSGGIATLVVSQPITYKNGVATPTNCVTPVGNTAQPCGTGISAGDWVAVTGCADNNYNTTIPLQVPATSTDSTLASTTVTYPVPPGAGASTTGCFIANDYGFPAFTTIRHNTFVVNRNITNAGFANNYITNAQGVSANDNGAATGCPACYMEMARNWQEQYNLYSFQPAATQTKALFIFAAQNSFGTQEGTPAESVLWDENSAVWNYEVVAGFTSISGFSPSLYTELNCPAGACGANNQASPPVTISMNVTNACSGAPNSGCIGFQGNYAATNCGVLGCTNNPANVPDFAPGTQDYHVFALQPGPGGSYFAAGNPGAAPQ
jgi:hypothetical protein